MIGFLEALKRRLNRWVGLSWKTRNGLVWNTFSNQITAGQTLFREGSDLGAWEVSDGILSPVPIPAAVWLFSTALIRLIGISK